MAHFFTHNCCKAVCISAIALTSLSSCMKDDLVGCPTPKISLGFDYTYNVKEADAFSAEVKNINVYVFDKNGKYFDTYVESADKFENGHRMEITDLNEGKYTFVCLARDKQNISARADGEDDEMEFTFTQLTPGVSTIDDLQEVMGKNEGENYENNRKFSALYTAQTSLNYEGKDVASELSLMKCTKTYRIVMLPYENDQPGFTPDNFDVRIKGSAALLDYKGDKVMNKAITYVPFSEKMVTNKSGETEVEGEKIDKALVYDLSSSRMFERNDDQVSTRSGSEYDDKRIVITDKRNNKVIFDHSLPWFLALCGERAEKNWDSQEYLDRQDHYVLTFYVPSDNTSSNYSLNAKIKVNGWVMNLQDADLGGSEKK